MKEEDQRIALAKWAGWIQSDTTKAWCIPGCWETRHHGSSWVGQNEIPDYLNDLNAMHEAEKSLTENEQYEFIKILSRFESNNLSGLIWRICSASAPQRCEALLRTLGLWIESN